MQRLVSTIVALYAALLFVVPVGAQAAPTVKVTNDPKLGNILTDDRGMTLYTFTRDEAKVSNCYDQCEQLWPVLKVSGQEQPVAGPGINGTLGVTTRREGTRQVTYNDMPLYYFARDSSPGDTNGQNVAGVWFVVAPGATRASFPAAPAPQAAVPAPAPAAPAVQPAAPASQPAAQPAAPTPAMLPRTGAGLFDPSFVALGAALVGLGLTFRRRGAR